MKASAAFGVFLALWGLPSCDAVLETFYPEFKNQAQSQGRAAIRVTVSLDADLQADYTNNNTPALPVIQKLVPFYNSGYGDLYADTSQVRDLQMEVQQLYAGNQEVRFENLYNATWAVLVSIDENENGQVDYDEPSVLAYDPDSGESTADMRYQLRSVSWEADLHRWSRAEPWLLEQLNDYGSDQGGGGHTVPPTVVLTAGATTVNQGETVDFDASQSYSDDGYLASFSWGITDTSDNLLYGPWSGDQLQFDFPDPGTYRVYVLVEDNWGNQAVDHVDVVVN